MIIYKATNKINGKSYIGQTIYDLKFRIRSHISEANRDNLPFHNALLKYKNYFEWRILEVCNSKNEMDEMEFHYIKQYNSIFPNGYNLTLGGEGNYGWIPNSENRENISLAVKKWWDKQSDDVKINHGKKSKERMLGSTPWNKGLNKQTDIRILNLSKKLKDRKLKEETKKKIGNSCRGQKRNLETKNLMRKIKWVKKIHFMEKSMIMKLLKIK